MQKHIFLVKPAKCIRTQRIKWGGGGGGGGRGGKKKKKGKSMQFWHEF